MVGKVFYRNKTGVELTEEGKNLYEYIKDSVETMSNAENIFSKYVSLDKGKIRIGGGNSITSTLILAPLVEFIKAYPNIDISIINGITDSLMQSLANGELDIVVLNLPYTLKKYTNVEIIELKETKFAFFASKEYLKKHKITNIKEIVNHKVIFPKTFSVKKRILDNYLKNEKIVIHTDYEVSSSSIMKKLVLNNVGIGFNNVEVIEEDKDKFEIIKEIEVENSKRGIAVMKKNMVNKATMELVKKNKRIL